MNERPNAKLRTSTDWLLWKAVSLKEKHQCNKQCTTMIVGSRISSCLPVILVQQSLNLVPAGAAYAVAYFEPILSTMHAIMAFLTIFFVDFMGGMPT